MNRLRICLALCIIISVGILSVSCSRSEMSDGDGTVPSELRQSLESQVDFTKGLGGAYLILGVNSGLPDSGVNGMIYLENLTDDLYISFANLTGNKNYILKLFLDYKENEFYINNELTDGYYFSADEGKSQIFKVRLNTENDMEMSHHLTAVIYTVPQVHFGDIGESTNHAGLILNYEISAPDSERKVEEICAPGKPDEWYELEYQGLVIGTQFETETDVVRIPPTEISAKAGETVKMSYRAGKYRDSESVLFVMLLDWKQTKINGSDFVYIENDPAKIGYGTIEFTAPNEPGSYEIEAFIVTDPFDIMDPDKFHSSDQAYRMTLTVEG